MNEIIEKIYTEDDFEYIYKRSISCVITIRNEAKRLKKIKSYFKEVQSIIEIDMNEEVDKIDIYLNDEFNDTYNLTDQITNLEKFVTDYIDSKNRVVLDITGMHIRVLAYFMDIIKRLNYQNVFFSYTTPEKYIRIKETISSEEYDLLYDFHDYNQGIMSVQCLMNMDLDKDSKKNKWVIFMGYEKKRTQVLYNLCLEPDDIIPVFTLPSSKPGWNNIALDENYRFIKEYDLYGSIDYVDSLSPFSSYEMLDKIIKNKEDVYHFMISCIGTKPNLLGTLAYVINNPQIEYITDEHSRNKNNSEGAGEIYFYELNQLLFPKYCEKKI